jgi:hypothetical protein
MTELKSLSLEGTRITDAGLAQLGRHKKLSYLSAGRTQVTADGAARLQELLPECRVSQLDTSALRTRPPR